MTAYRNERNRKKLLIPVVALVLCAAAMIGLGYAALVSDVTNTDNVVAADGLTARLEDGSGDLLGSSGFDATAEEITYSNSQDDDEQVFIVPAQELVLGGATLNIHVTDTSVTSITVYYVLKWTVTSTPTTYDITTSLEMTPQVEESPVTTMVADTTTVAGTQTSAPVTVSLTSDAYEAGQDFALVLKGDIGGSDTLSDKPVDLTYTITIYVAPDE
ncbi:MAG: hypothetical protein AB7E75_00845 [Candidatus Methanomethylophilaceae archaeon]